MSSATAVSSCEGKVDDQMTLNYSVKSIHSNHGSTTTNNNKMNTLRQSAVCQVQPDSNSDDSNAWDSDIDLSVSFDSQDPDLQEEPNGGGGVHGHVHYHTTSSWEAEGGNGEVGLDSPQGFGNTEVNNSRRSSSGVLERRKQCDMDKDYNSEGENSSVIYSLEESSEGESESTAEQSPSPSHSHIDDTLRPRPESIDLGSPHPSPAVTSNYHKTIQQSPLQHTEEEEDLARHRLHSIELSPNPPATAEEGEDQEDSDSGDSEQDEEDSVDYSLPSNLS